MSLRPWIARGLTVLVGSLIVAMVAAVLTGLLHAGGDRTAATAVAGVLWVSLTLVALAIVGQVILLSLDALPKPPPPPPPSPRPESRSPAA